MIYDERRKEEWMNILYVHGFGSKFDPSSDKVRYFSKHGAVSGINLDYTKPLNENLEAVKNAVKSRHIDMIVGTSMGGYMSIKASGETGLPFIAINPAINPIKSLGKKMEGVTFDGTPYKLSREALETYSPISGDEGYGLVVVAADDDVISPVDTIKECANYSLAISDSGGHRFNNIAVMDDEIQGFIHSVNVIGVEN